MRIKLLPERCTETAFLRQMGNAAAHTLYDGFSGLADTLEAMADTLNTWSHHLDLVSDALRRKGVTFLR